MNRRDLLLTALVGWLAFVWVSAWVDFPYLVDEYWYLYAWVTQPDFGLETFKGFMALRPVFALINTATFETGLIRYPKTLIWIYFLIHAVTLTYLVAWIITQCPPRKKDASSHSSKKVTLSFMLSAVPVILYPSDHEILYMALNLPYTLGLCFLVLAIYSARIWVRIPLLALSFASLETYLLPAFALLCLPPAWRFLEDKKWPNFWRALLVQLGVFLASYALFKALELILSQWYGAPSRDWSSLLNWEVAKSQAKVLFDFLWHIHFYKTNWTSTAIQLLLVIGVAVFLIKKNVIRIPEALMLLIIPWLSGLHYLFVPYYAPRAIYGASEIRNMIVAYLLFHFLTQTRTSWARAVPAILLLAYVAQLIVVFKIKDDNQAALSRSMDEIREKVAACSSPCTIEIESPQKGIKRDWMMLPEYHQYYAQWVAKGSFPEKTITFKVKPE